MDFKKVSEVLNVWDTIINQFDGSVPNFLGDNNFSELLNITGVSGGIAKQFDDNVKTLIMSLKSSKDVVKSISEEIKWLSNDLKNNMPGGDNPNASLELIDNYDSLFGLFAGMDYESFLVVLEALKQCAQANNVSLEDLLTDEQYDTVVKDIFIKNDSVGDDIKSMIISSKTGIMQRTLKELITGKSTNGFNISIDNEDIVRTYLSKIASDNNITLFELINDDSYSSILNVALNNFSKVSDLINSTDDIDALINNVMNGETLDNIDPSSIEIFKIYLENNKDKEHSDLLSGLQEFSKNSKYVSNLTEMKHSTISSALSEIKISKMSEVVPNSATIVETNNDNNQNQIPDVMNEESTNTSVENNDSAVEEDTNTSMENNVSTESENVDTNVEVESDTLENMDFTSNDDTLDDVNLFDDTSEFSNNVSSNPFIDSEGNLIDDVSVPFDFDAYQQQMSDAESGIDFFYNGE